MSETKVKLTKPEQSALEHIKSFDERFVLKYIKISLTDEIVFVGKVDEGAIRSASEKRAIISLINKGVLVHKSTAGMWHRFVISPLGTQINID